MNLIGIKAQKASEYKIITKVKQIFSEAHSPSEIWKMRWEK